MQKMHCMIYTGIARKIMLERYDKRTKYFRTHSYWNNVKAEWDISSVITHKQLIKPSKRKLHEKILHLWNENAEISTEEKQSAYKLTAQSKTD
jgi:predicted transglutaminase-like protease